MLTCLSVPPTPGRCWYGRSHYHTVHGWSLYIYGIRQQWLPHPQGFVIDRIWTLDDAAAPVEILYRAPLQNINIKKYEKCIFKEAVCIQRMFPIHMSYVAFSPLAVIQNFYRQTQRANVTFFMKLKSFSCGIELHLPGKQNICLQSRKTTNVFYAQTFYNSFFLNHPSSSVISEEMT